MGINKGAFRKETHAHRGRCAGSRTARVSAALKPLRTILLVRGLISDMNMIRLGQGLTLSQLFSERKAYGQEQIRF